MGDDPSIRKPHFWHRLKNVLRRRWEVVMWDDRLRGEQVIVDRFWTRRGAEHTYRLTRILNAGRSYPHRRVELRRVWYV